VVRRWDVRLMRKPSHFSPQRRKGRKDIAPSQGWTRMNTDCTDFTDRAPSGDVTPSRLEACSTTRHDTIVGQASLPAIRTPSPKERVCKPSIAKAEPSCPWRDGPGRWVAGTNAGVRIGHTPSRWWRSETVADSAARIACDDAMSLSALSAVSPLRWCDGSNQMRWIRVIREIRVQKLRCCDVSVSLCVSAPLWFNCDASRPLRLCGELR
jgi:hypothetical protein